MTKVSKKVSKKVDTKVENKKVSFRQRALELTQENLGKSGSVSKKDLLHEIILDNKMTRQDIVSALTFKVLEATGFDLDKPAEDATEEEFELYNKTYKTCKNSVDTMVSNSNNSATYNNDKKYYNEFVLVNDKTSRLIWIESK